MTAILTSVYLLAPFVLAAIFHGLVMKFGLFSYLAKPIDRGATWRGTRLIGDNKTFRGVFAVALGTAAAFALVPAEVFSGEPWRSSLAARVLLGLAAGAAAMLSELPNSFLKRRFGVAPGAPARGRSRALFYVLDQVDLLVGYWLVVSIAVPPTVELLGLTFGLVFVGHQLVTVIGYALGMRKTIR